jgi:hypothetical protein
MCVPSLPLRSVAQLSLSLVINLVSHLLEPLQGFRLPLFASLEHEGNSCFKINLPERPIVMSRFMFEEILWKKKQMLLREG